MIRRLAPALLALLASAALGQTVDAVAARQKILKNFGEVAKPIGAMLDGKRPVDLGVVRTAMTTYVEGAKTLKTLFPEDSKSGHDTAALPAIWQNKADVLARFDKLGSDASAALASVTDEASFMRVIPKVYDNCDGCHKQYRRKK